MEWAAALSKESCKEHLQIGTETNVPYRCTLDLRASQWQALVGMEVLKTTIQSYFIR